MRAKTMRVKDRDGRKYVYTLPEYKPSFWDGGFISDSIFYTAIIICLGVIINVL